MSQNTKTSDHDKYITLNNLKDFYKLLNNKFVATGEFYGGIKTGYLTDYSNKKYAVRLEDGRAYVEVPWISGTAWTFGTGITVEKLNSSDMLVKASLVDEIFNENNSSKTDSSNANRFYPVELDKSGKLAVTVPWVNEPEKYIGKEGVNVSSSNEITLDLYKKKTSSQGSGGLVVDVYNPITISTKIPETWETANEDRVYPVIFDGNNKLSVYINWKDTWQANTNKQAGYVAAPSKDSSMQAWMTDAEGTPCWMNLPEPIVTIPQASSVILGGIKLGYSSTDDTTSGKGRRYGVNIIDSTDEKQPQRAFVEIGTASKDNMGVVKAGGTTTSTEIAVKIKDDGSLYIDPQEISESTGNSSFTLGSATTENLGGIKIGYNADGTNKNYPIQLDEESKAYVNVPWINTTYTFNTGLSTSNNKISLNLINSENTTDEVSEPTWTTGTDIPENSEYYKCPVCIDKNGNLYVKVPAVKSNLSSDDPGLLNDNE